MGSLTSGMLVLFNDQPVASLCTEVRPGPLGQDTKPQAALCEKLNVDQSPDEPREETAHPDSPALQHGKILADHGKIALVEIAKRGKR